MIDLNAWKRVKCALGHSWKQWPNDKLTERCQICEGKAIAILEVAAEKENKS